MPLLLLAFLSITLVIAASPKSGSLHDNLEEQNTALIVTLPRVASTLVHAASASGDTQFTILAKIFTDRLKNIGDFLGCR